MSKKTIGLIFAIFTMVVWGTTFVATKVLLLSFTPEEILFFRFLLAFIVLFIAYPKVFTIKNWKHELVFAIAGLTGFSIYQYLENLALTYSQASNVSIIVSLAPLFTAVLAYLVLKDEKITKRFIIGFALSIIGIILVSFNGIFILKFNPKGDILAFLAVFVWAIYSIVTKIASKYEYNMLQVTRRITMYGVIFILPLFFLGNSKFALDRFIDLENLLLMGFLGIVASAMGFFTWNVAIKYLGTIRTTNFLYGVPVVTIIFAAIFLNEKLTLMGTIGVIITIVGLVISSYSKGKKIDNEEIKNVDYLNINK